MSHQGCDSTPRLDPLKDVMTTRFAALVFGPEYDRIAIWDKIYGIQIQPINVIVD